MRVVMVMFDSLNRHMLPPYGCTWTQAPNFARLARKTVTFDRSYVCSMPCMPARRDLLTGRPNFLHRSWGPIEPFDDSIPKMLQKAGVYTHLCTDHYHYFEDGGGTYHTQFQTWEFFRGQEGDPWVGQVADPDWPDAIGRTGSRNGPARQDLINRKAMNEEPLQSQPQTFKAGIDFIRRNKGSDNWFLQLETFDPHEPFFTQKKYKDLYPHDYLGPMFDWPKYEKVSETAEQVEHCRMEYAALLSMCDKHLGDVLDVFDEMDLWKDTMLIVWTDHGFLLGEHGVWAKIRWPFYEEIAHTPFFMWDPRSGKKGERRQSLVQPSIDLGPTLLEFFGIAKTPDMTGQALWQVIENDTSVRPAGIFGVHGGQVNVTDGRYVYMRAGDIGKPCYNYTLMPTHMRNAFSVETCRTAVLAEPFSFTKGVSPLRFGTSPKAPLPPVSFLTDDTRKTVLFDVEADPRQQNPMKNPQVEQHMTRLLVEAMKRVDAPLEQYERLGLQRD